jgi:hypothetical protein
VAAKLIQTGNGTLRRRDLYVNSSDVTFVLKMSWRVSPKLPRAYFSNFVFLLKFVSFVDTARRALDDVVFCVLCSFSNEIKVMALSFSPTEYRMRSYWSSEE